MKKRILVLTGGGDCPGLNAVIRAIVKSAARDGNYEILGSREAFNGVLWEQQEIELLDESRVAGIHVKGGTIIGTTNKGGPFNWPVKNEDGSWTNKDVSDELIQKIADLNIESVISIGGDGSQRISQALYEKGLNVVGVPKTIDNDLSATDFTFGFRTAAQIAAEAVDKLVTTAESHNRIMILEVMGRDAGWIALHAAVAGGAEVCLIPEIPYDIEKVVKRVSRRFHNHKGFANIVVAEGAKPIDGAVVASESKETGYMNKRLGGIGHQLAEELQANGCEESIRVTILGHLQRGGIPIAFDRILATQFGVKAFELARDGKFGRMVAYRNNDICDVSLKEATEKYNYVEADSYLLHTARSIGISFGDE